MLQPLTQQDIACIRQSNDWTPEMWCLEELLVLREAVIALTEPGLDRNEIGEITHRLNVQGVQVHHNYRKHHSAIAQASRRQREEVEECGKAGTLDPDD